MVPSGSSRGRRCVRPALSIVRSLSVPPSWTTAEAAVRGDDVVRPGAGERRLWVSVRIPHGGEVTDVEHVPRRRRARGCRRTSADGRRAGRIVARRGTGRRRVVGGNPDGRRQDGEDGKGAV